MSHLRNRRVRRLATLATATVVGATVFAVATTARGASHRAQVAAIDLTETCSTRVDPGTPIEFAALVRNSGDQVLNITAIDADAGTPDDTSDDIDLINAPHTGDTNANGLVDPAEEWTYTSSFTAPTEDVTNITGVDAIAADQSSVSDIAPCETDVVQQAQPGKIAGVKEVAGNVLVKEAGTNTFVPLNGQTEIPIGSQVNTLNGTVLLTAGLGGGKTNSADFYQGLFTIQQAKKAGAYMTLRIDGGNFRLCKRRAGQALSIDAPRKSIEANRKKRVRRLWGSGKGRFTTRGRYSSATVRGTKWLTEDRCDGTLTRVIHGVVRVRDFRAHKNVNVHAGHSYLARAPGS
jgi:hypothetical protein